MLMMCFCAVSSNRTTASLRITIQRSYLCRQRKPSACEPMPCPFSRTSDGCLSTFCDTRGSKVKAILRDCQGPSRSLGIASDRWPTASSASRPNAKRLLSSCPPDPYHVLLLTYGLLRERLHLFHQAINLFLVGHGVLERPGMGTQIATRPSMDPSQTSGPVHQWSGHDGTMTLGSVLSETIVCFIRMSHMPRDNVAAYAQCEKEIQVRRSKSQRVNTY